jgi:hypothetical protein
MYPVQMLITWIAKASAPVKTYPKVEMIASSRDSNAMLSGNTIKGVNISVAIATVQI